MKPSGLATQELINLYTNYIQAGRTSEINEGTKKRLISTYKNVFILSLKDYLYSGKIEEGIKLFAILIKIFDTYAFKDLNLDYRYHDHLVAELIKIHS